ncbi:methylenetetrahydrofolate reductase [Phorcysia thermohydrogeniphila]|uniref:Methylenetetrahydrofolate reductase n=1 Tax=Phorcysia thermohydrogeniphila TaxID=936138 RepID=A0A4R1GHW4_9BACT|nr:methylenetetrahydrofolate reductase [Phorcysia thermohydrogeniphila]TCK06385.1 5,10-methylenetetrahydrofolate reductase [Phorcysia thermohydrogeniphila]
MTFGEKLKAGKFLITAEVAPPRGTDWKSVVKGIEPLRGKVDAFNVTDCQRSMVRMSALAMSKLLLDSGFDPILQLTCRDRNRIALQSDLLGAAAFGIKNICLMTGDFTTLGDQKDAKPVFDVDSVGLIETAKRLTEGYLLNGKELKGVPEFCIGAVFNPFAGPFELQIMKLEKKIRAGALFIQTQPVYDVKVAEEVNSLISELGAVPIIGLLPIKSLRMANFMKKLNPTSIPDSLVEGLEKANDPAKYGWDYIIDLAHAIAEFGRGIHFMLVGKTEELASFIDYLRNHERYNHKF